jgi:hypothetical protein
MSFQTSALIVTWAALLLLALVVSGLVRQVHALSSGAPAGRVGLAPGSPAPAVERLGVRPPAVLLFLSEECRTCADVLDHAARSKRNGVSLHALYAGQVPAAASGLPLPVHGDQAELFATYDAIATPFAVVIDDAGRVARSEPLGSRDALRRLLLASRKAN